jgi:hypothetical protein
MIYRRTWTDCPWGAGTEHGQLLPADAQQGRTDLGTDAYHGPCPAKIEYADIHELQGFSKTAGLEFVGLGGFGDAGCMVMGQDKRGGVVLGL